MGISMDEKAANDGDKLKHPLLLEVLARCNGWGSLTYAESHAGAGKYCAADQLADKPHIANLFKLVSAVKHKPTEDAAGGRYYHLLRDWWSDENRQSNYPGSVLQAARFLTSQTVKAEFRVTEAHKDTHDRLVKAVTDYGIKPEHEKFQNKINWLTEKDSLVLLLDPLGFGEDFGKAREKKLNEGGMDLPTLTEVLTPCWGEGVRPWFFSEVSRLWQQGRPCKEGHGLRLARVISASRREAPFSATHAKSYYTFIMGTGKGKEVTDALLQLDWGKSWLSRTMHRGL